MNIIGADEVGVGSLSGPVVAAAVVFPEELLLPGVIDSKKLTATLRVNVVQAIHENSLHWALAVSSSAQIDRYGIRRCDTACMVAVVQRALSRFPKAHVVVDGNQRLPLSIPASQQTALPKADVLIPAVSAGSILAKVWRDAYMAGMAAAYPAYDFGRNAGYPTPTHLQQLELHGPCPEHRRSYRPVQKVLEAARRKSSSVID